MSGLNLSVCKNSVSMRTKISVRFCANVMVGQAGIEPATISLKGCCSTTELLTHRHFRDEWGKTQVISSKLLSVQKS